MKMLNNTGPSVDPWGMPVMTGLQLDFVLITTLSTVVQFLIHLAVCLSSHYFIKLSEMVILRQYQKPCFIKIKTTHCAALAHLNSHLFIKLPGCLSTIFLFTNLCCLLQIISLSFICLGILSRRICFIAFPGIKVSLTGLQFPGSSFLKVGTIFCFLPALKKQS